MVARKTAVSLAKGKWILFIDPDDYLTDNEAIVRAVVFLNDGFDVIEFNKNNLFDDGRIIGDDCRSIEISGSLNILNACFRNQIIFWMLIGKFFKTNILKKN